MTRVNFFYFFASVFLISILSITLSRIDGQVAVENSGFVSALVPERFGLLSAIFALFLILPPLKNLVKALPPLVLIFFVWLYFSAIWSESSFESIGRATTFLLTVLLPIALVIYLGVEKSLQVFWTFSFVLMVVCFFVSFSGSPYGRMGGAHDGLWRGIFVHKNHYGVFLAFFLITTVFSIGVFNAKLRLLAAALTVYQIFQAGSAAAIVLLILGFCYALIVIYVSKLQFSDFLKNFVIFIFLTTSALFVVPWLPVILEILGRDASLSGRIPLWTAVWGFALENPFGVGYRTGGGQEALDLMRSGSGWLVAPSSHNGLLNILLDIGFPGLFLWLIWIVPLVIFPYRSGQKNNAFRIPVEAVAIMILANSQVDSSSGAYAGYPIFLLFLLISARFQTFNSNMQTSGL